ncbi:MAG: DUF6036 family nucleotidyltransferase [Micrococcaceae bacterium]
MNNVNGKAMNRDMLLSLFETLNTKLVEKDIEADMFLVGGGAMALAYDQQRMTTDLDGIFQPANELRQIIDEISVEKKLHPDWMNDAAKGFLLGNDKNAKDVVKLSNLNVQVPSPEYLLAMKTTSLRASDRKDIMKLSEICGFNSAKEVLDNALKHVPTSTMIPIAARYKLEEIFNDFKPRNITIGLNNSLSNSRLNR